MGTITNRMPTSITVTGQSGGLGSSGLGAFNTSFDPSLGLGAFNTSFDPSLGGGSGLSPGTMVRQPDGSYKTQAQVDQDAFLAALQATSDLANQEGDSDFLPPDRLPGGPSSNTGVYSDSIGGTEVDLGSALSLFPDPVVGAVSAAQQNDYLNSILEQGADIRPTSEQIASRTAINNAADTRTLEETLADIQNNYNNSNFQDSFDLAGAIQQTQNRFAAEANQAANTPMTPEETEEYYNNLFDTLGFAPGTLGSTSVATPGTVPTTNILNSVQNTVSSGVNAVASKVGDAIDEVFRILRLPNPTKIIGGIQSGTVVWGQTGGSRVINTGTTGAGTQTGVTTGNAALDAILNKVTGVLSGRIAAEEVIDASTVREILTGAAAEELGVSTENIEKTIEGLQEVGSSVVSATTLNDADTVFGVDITGTETDSAEDIISGNVAPGVVGPNLTPDPIDQLLNATASTSDGDVAPGVVGPNLTPDPIDQLLNATASTSDGDVAPGVVGPNQTPDPIDQLLNATASTSDGNVAPGVVGPNLTPDSIDDTVVGDTVVGDTVVGDTVVGDTVVDDTVVGDTVVGDTVVGDTVVDDTVVGDTVVGDTVVGDTVVDDTVVGDTVVDDTVVDDTVVDDTVVDDIVVDDTVVDDTVVDDTVVDDTVVADGPSAPKSTGYDFDIPTDIRAQTYSVEDFMSPPPRGEAPPRGEVGGGGGGGGFGYPQSSPGKVRVTPGDLVDIDYLFDVGGDSIFAPELTEDEKDELLRTYNRGGEVNNNSRNNRHSRGLASLPMQTFAPGGSVGLTGGQQIGSIIGALAGGIAGLSGGGGGNSGGNQGYQGGVPSYNLDRSLKADAFVGERPAGSAGRNYFNTPATGLYNPQMETVTNDEGVASQQQYFLGAEDNRARRAATQGRIDAYDAEVADITTGLTNQYNTNQAAIAAQATADAQAKATAQAQLQAAQAAENTRVTNARAAEAARVTNARAAEAARVATQNQTASDAMTSQANAYNVSQALYQQYLRGLISAGEAADLIEGSAFSGIEADGDYTNAEVASASRLINANPNLAGEAARYFGISENEVNELVGYFNNNPNEFAEGGAVGGQGYYLGGPTDGMADDVPATIDNKEPARLSDGEFVIPADVVSHLGNGNSDAGAENLYSMMDRLRKDRTGNPNQGREIDPRKYLG